MLKFGEQSLRAGAFGGSLRLICALALVLGCVAGTCAQADLTTTASRRQAKREVAVTFDDLPAAQYGLEGMRYLTPKLLDIITRNRIPAIGFVNEGKLYQIGQVDECIGFMKMWVDAGLELGNHTFSHIDMRRSQLAAYEENIVRGETVTRILLNERGKQLRYFRHPYLFTGVTPEYKRGLESFLAGRGYTIAPVTIDNADYIFADVYARARRRGDEAAMKRIAEAYVPYMESIFDFFERLSIETLGYEVKQTLLVHANELNADHFDEIVQMMRRRGYTFISLEEALADPAYKLPDAQTGNGISWLHRWRMSKNMPVKGEPEVPDFISELYKAGQR